ncbi:MAG: hypothetical protein KDA50_01490 [Rhodobacteraceae bacterium]|nr:hypothetical protein [Paracoccaceae bacterium]
MQLHLEIREADHPDPIRMVARYGGANGCGPDRALMDLVEALSMGVAGLTRAREAGDVQAITDLARLMERTGDEAGLPRLRLAAISAMDCASRGDLVGLAATAARCQRLGDAAIAALWAADFGHG